MPEPETARVVSSRRMPNYEAGERTRRAILTALRQSYLDMADPPTYAELAAMIGKRSTGGLYEQIDRLRGDGLIHPRSLTLTPLGHKAAKDKTRPL